MNEPLSANKAFWSWNLISDRINLGGSFSSFFRCDEDQYPETFEKATSFFLKKDLQTLNKELKKHFDSRGTKPFSCKTTHPSKTQNSSFNVLWSGEVVEWNKQGEPVMMTGEVEKIQSQQNLSRLSIKNSAYLFAQLLDSIHESIYFKDLESRFIRINKACAIKFGLDDPADAVGKTDFDFFDEEHAYAAFEDEKKIMSSGSPVFDKVEKEVFPDQNNKTKWASTSKLPLYDDEENLIGTFGITRDITAHKRTEEKLIKSDEQFSKLSEQVPGFFYLYQQFSDGDAAFPFASEGIQDIYELNPEDVKHSIEPVLKRIHKNDLERVITSIRESAKTLREWECEYRVKLPKKGIRWVKGKAKPELQPDGSVVGYGYLTDITENKKTVKANVRLKEQFQAVLDAVPNLIFVKDLDGRYLVANKAACEFFGQKPDEIIGKRDVDFGIPEEKAALFSTLDRETITNDEPVFIPEDKTINPDGSEVWHQTIKLPFRQRKTNKPAILAIVTDITQRKQRETELSNSLNIIGEQNKRLMNFAHIVSHNLRNHAGNISMLLSLYDMEESVEEQQELLEHLSSASARLNESIEDLNEIIDQQYKTQDDRKDINIRDYISKIKEILTSEILAQNVTFREDVPPDLSIKYNPAYLESIILNLLSNAIKYRHPSRKPVIDIKAYEQEGHIFLNVSDNGLGIDLKKYGDKLFGMYNTFHGNENSKGIGLFITKNQIESMGGSIEIESEPSEGTTFKILLK